MTTERDAQVRAGFAVELTGLRLLREITDRADWRRLGQALAARATGTNWALGDWLLLHRGEWGDMYTQAEAITGLSYDSLTEIAATARAWPVATRNPALSWSLHRVAKTAAQPQAALAQAAQGQWSVQRLQATIAAANARRRPPAVQATFRRSGGGRTSTHVRCPQCSLVFLIHGNRVATPPQSAARKRRGPRSLGIPA